MGGRRGMAARAVSEMAYGNGRVLAQIRGHGPWDAYPRWTPAGWPGVAQRTGPLGRVGRAGELAQALRHLEALERLPSILPPS